MKVMIVEDEGVAARRLQKLLEAESLELISHCKSNKEVKAYLEVNDEPELYFMDIHLNDGIIFELFEEIEIHAPIIFTTAYDQYAIKAFKQNSIDYLLKPINPSELKIAIEKCKKIYGSKSSIDLQSLSELILSNQNSNYKERIRVKIGDRLKSFQLSEVLQIFSQDKITFIQIASGRSYPIDYSIEQILESIDPQKFFRVNRSTIVNIDHIKDVVSYSNSRLKVILIIENNNEIIVARDRVKNFKNWLG